MLVVATFRQELPQVGVTTKVRRRLERVDWDRLIAIAVITALVMLLACFYAKLLLL